MKSINIKSVEIHSDFWKDLLYMNENKNMPHQYKMLKDTGRLEAISGMWKGKNTFTSEEISEMIENGAPHIFWDSDVAKWIEAASYILSVKKDIALESQVDAIVDGIDNLQTEDGYINSYFTLVEPENRFKNLRWRHELYCAGHLIEAAVAYYKATKKCRFLNAMIRYADYIYEIFGDDKEKLKGYPGHEEIELALVKLYRVTKNKKYLDLSNYFILQRGKSPSYWDIEDERNSSFNDSLRNTPLNTYEYAQAHKPATEQTEAVGHAVRALYLYSGMADVALETNNPDLFSACKLLWDSVVNKKKYITGGYGARHEIEGFGADYELPNRDAYAETCASIAFVFWAARMLNIECNSIYSDEIERAIYNTILASVSQDGLKYFYVNPLESSGNHHRSEWFGCACCPPNIARLFASINSYIYSYDEDSVAIHQFIASQVSHNGLTLVQRTEYPFSEKIIISLDGNVKHNIKIRIPGWCSNPSIKLNGERMNILDNTQFGYFFINKLWQNDVIELDFPMEPTFNYSNPNIITNAGMTAVSLGPMVYCLEECDNGKLLNSLYIDREKTLDVLYRGLFDKYPVILASGVRENFGSDLIYSVNAPVLEETKLMFVPYCTWDNRAFGEMRVWVKYRI